MMKKIRVLLILLLLSAALMAQIPSGYYDGAKGKSGAALKTALYNKIKGHTSVSYTPGVWNAFPTTDSRADGKVWDIYSSCTFTWGTNQDKGSGGGSECQLYNREHSFPQSWFNEATPMVSDLFHIYPTDKYVNGERGNLPYGEVGSGAKTYGNGSKRGSCSYPGYSGTVFEPINEYKGDLARGYMYMVTRYENVVASWFSYAEAKPTINGTDYPAFQAWALSLLLKWHRQDPVSQKEIDRNSAIFGIQNNRNPFIDHPELAEYIWGDSISKTWGGGAGPTAASQLALDVDFTMYPNPASTELTLQPADGVQLYKVDFFDMQGVLHYTQEGDVRIVSLSNLKSNIYIVRISTSKGAGAQLLRVVR